MRGLGWKQGIGQAGLIKVDIFKKSRQPSLSKSSNTDVTKILNGKVNKFHHTFDYALSHGDFGKFLSCAGWAGIQGIGRAGLIKVVIF